MTTWKHLVAWVEHLFGDREPTYSAYEAQRDRAKHEQQWANWDVDYIKKNRS